MTYHVKFTRTSKEEIHDAFVWLRKHSPNRAHKWLKQLIQSIRSLESYPQRCVLAPENDQFEIEIRQLFYGKIPNQYRVLFTIDQDVVYILHVWHGARIELDFIE